MITRRNKTNKELFWGCKDFPICRNTKKITLINKGETASVVEPN